MKNNFKKLMSVLLVAIMISTIFSISVSAAAKTVTLEGATRKLNGVTYTAKLNDTLLNLPGNTYTSNDPDGNPVVYTIDKENNKITFQTADDGYFYFPENFFVMEGHEQDGWGSSKTGGTAYKVGRKLKITSNKTYYGRYNSIKYVAEFLPGANGEGVSQTIEGKTYGQSITLPDALFTCPGFVQVGWSLSDGSDIIEFDLGASYDVFGDVKFYPVWQKVVLDISHNVNKVNFGSLCEDYQIPEKQAVVISNLGNAAVSLTLPTSTAFDIIADGSTIIAGNGGTLTVYVQPKSGLDIGMYTEALLFDFGSEDANFTLTAKFGVNAHFFVKYIYNNDATYSANGTETAECFSGCGTKHSRAAEGTMKKYSADNNTADGLMKEYVYHKTVKFVAFGSGMDATSKDNLTKRFRPTEWSVADTEFKGTFDKNTTDYTVKYDHGDGNFGTYTLTIKYVEEEKNADGEWVATGVEDIKTFKYSIGPSEKDNQEVVRPNMIVSIIFGLFGYLIDLITSGSLF